MLFGQCPWRYHPVQLATHTVSRNHQGEVHSSPRLVCRHLFCAEGSTLSQCKHCKLAWGGKLIPHCWLLPDFCHLKRKPLRLPPPPEVSSWEAWPFNLSPSWTCAEAEECWTRRMKTITLRTAESLGPRVWSCENCFPSKASLWSSSWTTFLMAPCLLQMLSLRSHELTAKITRSPGVRFFSSSLCYCYWYSIFKKHMNIFFPGRWCRRSTWINNLQDHTTTASSQGRSTFGRVPAAEDAENRCSANPSSEPCWWGQWAVEPKTGWPKFLILCNASVLEDPANKQIKGCTNYQPDPTAAVLRAGWSDSGQCPRCQALASSVSPGTVPSRKVFYLWYCVI